MKSYTYALAIAGVVVVLTVVGFLLLRDDSSLPPTASHVVAVPAAVESVAAPVDEVVERPAPPPATVEKVPARRAPPRKRDLPEEEVAGSSEDRDLPAGEGEIVIEAMARSGDPKVDLSVQLLSGRASREEVTDINGLAIFAELGMGTYSFRIGGDGVPEVVSAKEILLNARERKLVTVTIDDTFGLEISGRVLDSAGDPVAGIVVFARKQIFEASEGDYVAGDPGGLAATSAADGSYILEGLEAADYLLRTQATETYPPTRKIVRAGISSVDLILDVTREVEFFGWVTRGGGRPVEGARVVPIGQASRQARSDENGRYSAFVALSVDKSAYALRVRMEGFKDHQKNIFASELQDRDSYQVDIELEPIEVTAHVRGVILDTEDQPVAQETVTIYSAALSGRHRATTNTHGTFDLGRVQVGDYRLWVYPRHGYNDYSLDPVTVPEHGLDLTIVLDPVSSGALTGRLVDPLSEPIPNFKLWVRSMKALGNSLEVVSDSSGHFGVEDVPAGELIFETRSTPRLSVRGVKFDPNNPTTANMDLVLDWGFEVFQGVVLDSRRNPVGGASVTLSWSAREGVGHSAAIRSAHTDSDGYFSFAELSAVEHKLSVSAEGFKTKQDTVRVGVRKALEIILTSR